MPERVIDDVEFVWMLRGRARVLSESGELELPAGNMLLVLPGLRHSIVWDPRRESRHGYVHFEIDTRDGLRGAVRTRRMTEDDPLAGICAYLLWLGRDRPGGWERRAQTTLGFLLDVFVSGPLLSERNRARLGPFSAVVDLLRSEWSSMPLRRVGVEELASAAGVSRSYLERLFRAEVQRPAASTLESLRFVRVESLLARTDMPLGAIARQCGFADLFHLSHRFKRRYGLSPTAYRAAGGLGPSVLDEPGVARLASAIWG